MVTWRSLLAFLKWPDERQTEAVPGAAQPAIGRGARLSEVAAFSDELPLGRSSPEGDQTGFLRGCFRAMNCRPGAVGA